MYLHFSIPCEFKKTEEHNRGHFHKASPYKFSITVVHLSVPSFILPKLLKFYNSNFGHRKKTYLIYVEFSSNEGCAEYMCEENTFNVRYS